MPTEDWLCLATSNIIPNALKYDQFVRKCIDNGIFEFKGHGAFGGSLDGLFDEIIVKMEVDENHEPISVMTSDHTNETLVDAFWQCFFVTCLPDSCNFDNISIVLTDIEGKNNSFELQKIIS